MKVEIAQVRAIAERLFAHLEETGRCEFDVSEDYYWSIVKEEIYDPLKDPGDLTLGQLSDDWNELKAILENEKPPIGHALVWLSSVLRIIGEKSVF